MVERLVYWLRKDRWFADEYKAAQAHAQYSLVEDRPPPDRYGTSILGVVNGWLPMVGLVLVAHLDEHTHEPVRPWLSIRRKWW